MLKYLVIMASLMAVPQESSPEVIPPLSNGHLSLLHFKNKVDSCQLNDIKLEFFTLNGEKCAFASLPHAYDKAGATLSCLADGNSETLELPVTAAEYQTSTLKVDKKFVDKKSPQLKARIKKESAKVQKALADMDSERHWSGEFFWPRDDAITSPFGVRRLFNGVQKSVHFGLDLDGQVGDPIHVMADGRVALASPDHFYPGSLVIIDHGKGLQSLYFHMSRIDVKTGDMVKKGQLIGAVGKSGRVTGPHLHWSVKLYGNYFDPADLFREELKKWLR